MQPITNPIIICIWTKNNFSNCWKRNKVVVSPQGRLRRLHAERFDIVSDWKEVRHYIPIKGECIESIYFGVNITEGKKERIVNYARTKLNPNIKLYQMRVDENAFRLKTELIY